MLSQAPARAPCTEIWSPMLLPWAPLATGRPLGSSLVEQVIYVGHDSCSYCDEHGETVKTGTRGHVMTFPFRNTASGHVKLRVAEEVKAYSHDALERNTTVSSFFL